MSSKTFKILGLGLALAAIVSLVFIQFYNQRVAEGRLAEFNRRDPNFAKKTWAFRETGPRNRLGLEVTPSVGLVFIDETVGGTMYPASAVVRALTTGQIWEVGDGKARLLWSPNPVWLVSTDPALVGLAVAALFIGIYLFQIKAGAKAAVGITVFLGAIPFLVLILIWHWPF